MDAAALCAELVRLPTARPQGTGEIIAHCAEFLAPAGFRLAHQFETTPGIQHALLERPGDDPPLLLDAHVDTVPPGEETGWSHAPLSGEIAAGRVWGRGASDDKGPLAAALVALAGSKSSRHLLLSLTGDEETDMLGMRTLVGHPLVRAASQAVVLEPSDLVPVYAHKGNARLRVEISGHAAHASRPWEGHNAVEDKLRLLAALQEWFATGEGRSRLSAFGDEPPTLVVTREETPNPAYNVIPDRATCWLNYRPLPIGHPQRSEECPALGPRNREHTEESGAGLSPFSSLACAIAALSRDLGVRAAVEVEFSVPPFLTPADSPLLSALARLSGRSPVWVAYGTHAGYLSGIVAEVAVFGPGSIQVSHSANEHVEIAQLAAATAWLGELLG